MKARKLKCWLVLIGIMLVPQSFAQNDPDTNLPRADWVVASGTVIPIVLTSFLNTRSSLRGDTFYAETIYPIFVQQQLIIPRGALVQGTVTEVKRPGLIKGRGSIAIRLDTLMLPNGVERNLIASFKGIHGPGMEKLDRQTETVEMDSTIGEDVGKVAGAAAQGAVIGAIVSRRGNKGDAVATGAIIGGSAGLAMVLASRGRELVLEPGTQFDVELKKPLRFVWGEIDFSSIGVKRYAQPTAGRSMPARNRQSSWPANFGRRNFRWLHLWP